MRTQRDDGEVRASVRAHAPGCARWRQQSGGDGRMSVYATFTHVYDPFDGVLLNSRNKIQETTNDVVVFVYLRLKRF